jgi:serine/threonine protein kinase
LEVKLRNARIQCDQLFWQTAHEILPEFPEEQTAMIEIPGQRVGNLILVGQLAEGGFGKVYKCQNMETGVFSAVKVLPKRNVKSRCQLQQIALEYSVLRRVSHPNVVSGSEFLHGVKNLYLIMELAGSTTLYNTIRAEGDKGLLWARAQKLLFQIASGVAHLHESIAHCDLKPENISVCKDGCVKVVDFGQAADVTLEVPVLKRPRGTMPFIAPEVMILSPHWDPISCDLWQLGVILFEVLCGIGSFEALMGWGGIDFRSLSQLRVCEEELQVHFAKTAKVNTLAVVGSLCDLATPAFATELLADMLQLTTTARLPASCMASRLNR